MLVHLLLTEQVASQDLGPGTGTQPVTPQRPATISPWTREVPHPPVGLQAAGLLPALGGSDTFLGSMLNFFLPIAIFRFRCKVLLRRGTEQGGGQQRPGHPGPQPHAVGLTCPRWPPAPPLRSWLR